jgi:signal transduction histidine kinase
MRTIVRMTFCTFVLLSAAYGVWHVNRMRGDFLSREERVWLKQHYRSITVASDPRWTPDQAIEEQRIYHGISSDFMALVEQKLGVRFMRIHADSWDQILAFENEGKIDIHPVLFHTPDRDNAWLFTESYMRIPVIAVMRASLQEHFQPQDIWRLRMAVGHGYGIENFLRKLAGEPLLLIPVESDRFGLIKAAIGEIDVMVTDLASASYFIEQEGLTNLRLAATLGALYEFRFASRRERPELHSILDKALTRISREERRRIYDRWVVFDVRPFYRSVTFWYVAGVSVAFVVLLLAVILAWNGALKVEVQHKTAALEEARLELEARVLARTAELAQANAALEREMQERAETARDLLHVSGNERARIGRDLHDSLGQKMVGILYLTRALADQLADAGRGEADAARKILTVIDDVIREMRQIVRGLLPVDILDKGFVAALEGLLKESGQHHGIACGLACLDEHACDRLDNALATNLYRIVQEAIGNALKHARGLHEIRVQLRLDGQHGILQIDNDGDRVALPDPGRPGMGCKIMRYRAMLAGGTLEIRPRPAGGVSVVCRFDPWIEGSAEAEMLQV